MCKQTCLKILRMCQHLLDKYTRYVSFFHNTNFFWLEGKLEERDGQ